LAAVRYAAVAVHPPHDKHPKGQAWSSPHIRFPWRCPFGISRCTGGGFATAPRARMAARFACHSIMSDDCRQRITPAAPLAGTLVSSDRFLAAIVESSDDAIIGKTLQGTITSWNRAAEVLYGYAAAEVIGQPIALIIPADRPDELPSIMAKLGRGEIIDHFETIRVRNDGARIDVSVSISPIRDGSGQIIGAASIGRDITERKRAERERHELQLQAKLATERSETALREQRATLEIVNQVGRMLNAELDLEALVQSVTDTATKLTGAHFGAFFYNALDERGEFYTLYAISGVPREAFAQFPLPRNTALFGPTFRGEGMVRIADVRQDARFGQNSPFFGMPEGHLPVVSYLAAPVIGHAGEVLGGLFFGHPEPGVFGVRAQRLAEGLAAQAAVAVENARLFQRAQQELEARRQTEAEKEAFVDAVAHDLANPLTALKGQAQLLRRRLQQGRLEALNSSVDAIEAATERAARMLGELTDAARLAGDRPLTLDRAPTDLIAVTGRLVAEFQAAAAGHSLRLHSEHAEHAEVVGNWDADRLTRVLENLLANAIKYSPGKSPIDIHIECREDAAGGVAILSVVDRGVGIPAADLPHLFERFRRGGNVTGRIAGTGLGLWGSQQIVVQHGGTIEIESAEHQGTTVTVRLPLSA
jgi:PAS domain S-box-containing protein